MAYKNRIREYRKVQASELRAHPQNWRLHPENQRSAISAVLEDVGFVDAVIARETEDGLELIDGHLRAEVSGDTEIPVLIVDLDDSEARRVLATFDPLGELAITSAESLNDLLGDLGDEDNADLRKLIADLHHELFKQQEREDTRDPNRDREIEGMALRPHEHYDYLVVLAKNTQEWNQLCEKLDLRPVEQRRGRLGTSRAIHAERLLERLK